jgi:hypothetical protein
MRAVHWRWVELGLLVGVGRIPGPRQRTLLWQNAALGVQVAEYVAGLVQIGNHPKEQQQLRLKKMLGGTYGNCYWLETVYSFLVWSARR